MSSSYSLVEWGGLYASMHEEEQVDKYRERED